MHSFTQLPGIEPMTGHFNPMKLHSSMPGLQGPKVPDSLIQPLVFTSRKKAATI
jgi:hypothetical protein